MTLGREHAGRERRGRIGQTQTSVRVRPVQESLDAGAAQESEEQGGDGRSVDNGEIADAGESTSFFYGPGEQRSETTTDENTSAADAEMLGQEPWDSMEEYEHEYGDRAQGEEIDSSENLDSLNNFFDEQIEGPGAEPASHSEQIAEASADSETQDERVEDKAQETETGAEQGSGAMAKDDQDPMDDSGRKMRRQEWDDGMDMGM